MTVLVPSNSEHVGFLGLDATGIFWVEGTIGGTIVGRLASVVVARSGYLCFEELLGRLRNPRERPIEPTARAIFLEDFSSNLEGGFGIFGNFCPVSEFISFYLFIFLDA